MASVIHYLWLVFTFAISGGFFLRYLFFRHVLLREIEKYRPEIYQQIHNSRVNFIKFIKQEEDTGDNSIDVLRGRAKEARSFATTIFISGIMFLVVFSYKDLL